MYEVTVDRKWEDLVWPPECPGCGAGLGEGSGEARSLDWLEAAMRPFPFGGLVKRWTDVTKRMGVGFGIAGQVLSVPLCEHCYLEARAIPSRARPWTVLILLGVAAGLADPWAGATLLLIGCGGGGYVGGSDNGKLRRLCGVLGVLSLPLSSGKLRIRFHRDDFGRAFESLNSPGGPAKRPLPGTGVGTEHQ